MSYAAPQETHWQPATFLERGVAVPFTTPALAGARARPAARYVELIVPHPAGVRGVYIMAWSELGNFCAPSLHDLLLCERIAGLSAVTPRAIRLAARAVAAEGAAGRAAQRAAELRAEAERQARNAASIALLQNLVAQTGTTSAPPCPATELDQRAKTAIRQLAPRLGLTPAGITTDIETLAEIFATIGLPPAVPGPSATLLADLAWLAREVAPFASQPGQAGISARLVASGAMATRALATAALAAAQAQANDLATLLAQLAAGPGVTTAQLTRADWLLDGWDHAVALWRLAEEESRRAALCDMAAMVPVIPPEAANWGAAPPEEAARHHLRGQIQRFDDWRTPTVLIELTARNERARALTA